MLCSKSHARPVIKVEIGPRQPPNLSLLCGGRRDFVVYYYRVAARAQRCGVSPSPDAFRAMNDDDDDSCRRPRTGEGNAVASRSAAATDDRPVVPVDRWWLATAAAAAAAAATAHRRVTFRFRTSRTHVFRNARFSRARRAGTTRASRIVCALSHRP